MANPEHLEILEKGITEWNRWRDKSTALGIGANLSGANFVNVNLGGANLNNADLSQASLGGADLREANLFAVDLRKADLAEADLGYANLNEANLKGARLHRAKLHWAQFDRTNLSNADLSDAFLYWAYLRSADVTETDFSRVNLLGTTLGDLDLHLARGLSQVIHHGPSNIGIDTIYRSGGKIPEVFLRGCGIPDTFISYTGSLVGKPIEFYSCFISYSTQDQDFAIRLHNDLQSNGVRCWFAPEDMKGGKKIHEQIDQAIRLHDKLLLILSEASMGSEWVNFEITKARQREKRDQTRVLFPLGLVGFEEVETWQSAHAVEISEYFIPDFSTWKNHDKYAKAFERLLRDLKAGPT